MKKWILSRTKYKSRGKTNGSLQSGRRSRRWPWWQEGTQPPTDHIIYMKWSRNQNFSVYILYINMSCCYHYVCYTSYILYIFNISYVLYKIHKMELKATHILCGRRRSNHQQITSWKKLSYVPCMYNLT